MEEQLWNQLQEYQPFANIIYPFSTTSSSKSVFTEKNTMFSIKKFLCNILPAVGPRRNGATRRRSTITSTDSGNEMAVAHIYAHLSDKSLVPYQGPHITVRLRPVKDRAWSYEELDLAAKMTLIHAEICSRSFEPDPKWDPHGTLLNRAYYKESPNKIEYQVFPLLPLEFQPLAINQGWLTSGSDAFFHELSMSSRRQTALIVRWAPNCAEQSHRRWSTRG